MADGSALPFDWKTPDYVAVFDRRLRRLQRIREAIRAEKEADEEVAKGLKPPPVLVGLKAYYRDHIPDFINDWGVTVDPRNVEVGLPPVMPFILFPRQRDYIDFVIRKWRERSPGLVEKSRDVGVSWLCVSTGVALCLHFDGMQVGFGSRKEEYVDRAGDPKSLFWKARAVLRGLPREFRGGWEEKRNSAHMRLVFPASGSSMTGEAGDNIGRGDRTGIYFVDESAHLERPQLVEASLSQTTNCRIDQSSVNGPANAFAEKRWKGKIEVFIFDWREDPRKAPTPEEIAAGSDGEWYQHQVDTLDPVVLAQEVDRDYNASVEGVLIPGDWVRASIDAHLKLGISVSGKRAGALDVADEGRDLNAYCSAKGFVIDFIKDWSGKGGDVFATTVEAHRIAGEMGDEDWRYDADGIGSGVRGADRVYCDEPGRKAVPVYPYRGSGEVEDKDSTAPGTDRTNEDFFANFKAQAWWSLRWRFYKTWLMVREAEAVAKGLITIDKVKHRYGVDEIISISSETKDHLKLVAELGQATFSTNGAGKILVDKAPEGMKSPNMADAVVIRFAPMKGPMRVSREAVQRAAAYRR